MRLTGQMFSMGIAMLVFQLHSEKPKLLPTYMDNTQIA